MWKVCAALCALAPLCVQATTLVALWTPERVLLAADSRVVMDNGAAQGCKIGHSGTTWFAFAGLVLYTSTRYVLGDILRGTMQGTGDLRAKAQTFTQAAQPSLTAALAALRRDDPMQYAVFTNGRPILQAILADQSEGRLSMVTVAFALDADGVLQPRHSFVDGSDLRGPRIVYAGQQARIREYLQRHRDWITEDNVQLVEKLVQLEVDAATPWVGGPVDVVELARQDHAARWIKAKPACRD